MSLTVREWRRVREISQENMAQSLGIHVNTYQLWEKNPEKIPISKAMEIASLLNVGMDDIVFQET